MIDDPNILKAHADSIIGNANMTDSTRLASLYGAIVEYCTAAVCNGVVVSKTNSPEPIAIEPKKTRKPRAKKEEPEVEPAEDTNEPEDVEEDSLVEIPDGTIRCDNCKGVGKKGRRKCKDCDGDGFHEVADVEEAEAKAKAEKPRRRSRRTKTEEPEDSNVNEHDDDDDGEEPAEEKPTSRRRRVRKR